MKKEIFMNNLGLYIKMERLRQKISQEQLSTLADCGLSQIGTLERGEKSISFYNLYKIVKVLNLDFDKIIKNIENK